MSARMIACALLAIAALGAGCASEAGRPAATAPSLGQVAVAAAPTNEANMALARSFFDAFARADAAGLDAVLAPDFVGHGASPTPDVDRAKLKTIAASVAQASPDHVFTTEDLFADGDRVVWRGVVRGTYQDKTAFGVEVTPGRTYAMKLIHVFRVAGGKLVEGWIARDDAGMLRQLGALPGSASPSSDAPSAAASDTADARANAAGAKQLVLRSIDELWGRRDAEAAMRFFAPDLVNHEAIPQAQGAAGMRTIASKLLTAFPDAEMKVEDVIASGDRVACRVTFHGTNSAPLAFVNAPLPATGKTVTVSQIHVFRVKGDRIVESWGTRDDLGLMKQLGVLPAPRR